MQLVMREAGFEEIIANPLFKKGYAQVWAREEHALDRRWDDAEQQAYERGRHFAQWLIGVGEQHIPLTRGPLANPRARINLMMAMREGAVR